MRKNDVSRRSFVSGGGAILVAAGGALVTGGSTRAGEPKRDDKPKHDDEDVPPTEDLMREHGILRRVLFVYAEARHRLDTRAELDVGVLQEAAGIVRAFIEDYHERDEEQLIFPKLQKAGRLVDLVQTLLRQHQAGRKLTADIQRLATPAQIKIDAARSQLSTVLEQFSRMYGPHAAREDTVLFPAFRSLTSEKELAKLQDLFEDKEKALPGGGFEKMVAAVARLEDRLHIGDLNSFTPSL